MHKAGGCYGDNLECGCPFDLAAAITAITQANLSATTLGSELAEA
jgi:hypothetical protein